MSSKNVALKVFPAACAAALAVLALEWIGVWLQARGAAVVGIVSAGGTVRSHDAASSDSRRCRCGGAFEERDQRLPCPLFLGVAREMRMHGHGDTHERGEERGEERGSEHGCCCGGGGGERMKTFLVVGFFFGFFFSNLFMVDFPNF